MASVGLLAAGMAHEVGTPLSAIIGYGAILRQELHGDQERLEFVQRIEDDARRIDHIVRHLLDYARPRKGEYGMVDAGELIQGAFNLLDAQGLFKKIRVSFAIPDNLPKIKVDGQQFQQVLINLMINARDAMPSGGELHITASRDGFAAPPAFTSPEPAVVMGRRKNDFHGAFRITLPDGGRVSPLPESRSPGLRRGNSPGTPRKNLRPVLYHQGTGQGDRARPGHLRPDHRFLQRPDHRAEYRGLRNQLLRLAASGKRVTGSWKHR